MASALHRSQHQLRTAEEWLTFDSCLHKTQKCNISPALAARFRRAQSHECHTCIGLQLSEKFKGKCWFSDCVLGVQCSDENFACEFFPRLRLLCAADHRAPCLVEELAYR